MKAELHSRLLDHVDRYAQVHHNAVNRALHFLGIPMLWIAYLGLLSKLRPVTVEGQPDWLQPSLAWVGLTAAAVWYVLKDRKIGLLTSAFLVACFLAGSRLPPVMLVAIGLSGAMALAMGHYLFEGKPPATLSRPIAILESAAWMVSKTTGIYEDQPGA